MGVVCALASEARHLGRATRSVGSLKTLADGTLVAVSGMGCDAAARGANALLDAGATALVSWGMAGGLDPRLAPGTIVLPSEVSSTEGIRIPTTPLWRTRLATGLRACHGTLVEGRLLTTTKSVGSAGEKAMLFRETQAVAVDMESLAVAEVARERTMPFIAVRVIVDSAADSLPPAVTAAADSKGQLDVWRLIGALARAPADLPPLIRLARRYAAANRSLAMIAGTSSLASAAFEPPERALRAMERPQ